MSLTPDEMDRKREIDAIARRRPITAAEAKEYDRLVAMENYRGVALGDR